MKLYEKNEQNIEWWFQKFHTTKDTEIKSKYLIIFNSGKQMHNNNNNNNFRIDEF